MDQAPRMMMELRPFLVWSSMPEFVLAHHASKELLSGWGERSCRPTLCRMLYHTCLEKTHEISK
uniref:Uncharacterized protein n=1 Tax=Arundo donax TaxID=35708 RepID=A0A0A8Y3R2_ARUDO